MKFLVGVLVAFCLYGVVCSERHVYCGRRLADTLAVLCSSNLVMKRSPMDLEHEGPGWWWPAERAQMMSGRGKRVGIADECCLKPCTMDELLSYC